jgi:hypothetical protein
MKLTQRVSNVFIVSAELNLLLGTSPLFQNGWTRVEQKFSLFFRDGLTGKRHLITSHLLPRQDVMHRSARLDHPISQRWPITDACFQFIAIMDRPDARRRSS